MIRISIILLLFISNTFWGQSKLPPTKKIQAQKSFYKNGKIAISKWIDANRNIDSVKTYHPNGKIWEQFYFNKKGKFHGKAYQYTDDGDLVKKWTIIEGNIQNQHIFPLPYDTINTPKRIKNFEIYNTKIQKNVRDFNAFFNRAVANFHLGNLTLALHDFLLLKKYLDLSEKIDQLPKDINIPDIYYYLGKIYEQYDQENLALYYKYKAMESSHNASLNITDFSLYLYKTKNFHLAKNIIEKNLYQIKNKDNLLWILAAIAVDLEDYQSANKYLQGLNQSKTSAIYFLGNTPSVLKGVVAYKLGDIEKGLQILNTEVNINSNHPLINKWMGVIHAELNNKSEAIDFLTKANNVGFDFIWNRNEVKFYLKLLEENNSNPIKHSFYSNQPYLSPNPSNDKEIQLINPPVGELKYQIFHQDFVMIQEGVIKNGLIPTETILDNIYSVKIMYEDKSIQLPYIKKK